MQFSVPSPRRPRALVTGLVTAVPGRAQAAGEFHNPLNSGADPSLRYAAGQYRLLTTQGDAIRMWSSPSLATLLSAPVQEIFADPDPSRNKQVWAPAMYPFDGRWYIYYTASDGTSRRASRTTARTRSTVSRW